MNVGIFYPHVMYVHYPPFHVCLIIGIKGGLDSYLQVLDQGYIFFLLV